VADGGAAVVGFTPATRAFRFTNDFPKEPVAIIGPARGPHLNIGDASRGLCGGMTYAVRDLFEAAAPPPPDTRPPPARSPLFRFLVRRLIQSWDLPRGALRYYRLMLIPDADRRRGVLARHGAGHVTAIEEWPRVRLDLDQGRLSPLGLVTVRSANPFQLGHNHQVLAYAYTQAGTAVTLRVYDPNTPLAGADGVTLTFDVARPHRGVPITHNVLTGGREVRTFFRTRYRPARPPFVAEPARPLC
jgi:hypothetical protein